MRYRKLLGAGAVAASAILLAGCSGGGSGSAGSSASSASSGAAASKGGLVYIITPAPSNIFFKAEADAAAAEAKKLGYTATEVSHDDDPTKQANLIDTAISRHAKAIVLDNAGADVSVGPIQKALKAGIPTFLIDREINKTGVAKAQIVANNSQGAADVATYFAKELNGKGNYLMLTGLATDTNAGVREQATTGVLSQYPGMKLLAKQAADWDQTKAFNTTQTLLQRYKDVDGIVANNDTMALGVVAALKQAKLAGKVKVVGFDGSPDAATAIKAGTMIADGIQPATAIAKTAVDQADVFIRTGKTGQPEKQSVNCQLVTKDNIAKYGLFSLDG